ncbi:ribonucleoside-diphosphate reductase, adenosylcobalamin-dependent [Candidatus Peregrinibacteria bacterium CG10_big_fil_rev_8_21_14_0_10_49_16]|nr:MAG: ribonucleoside-diphosphate reductase, adenosylcobalamin-dependent [Candidatus Peregrinibacteria bacterium CG22_combo_CG10-13_8_21_14_all_49_11]PIR51754.1 MAG: ribonucleoside-diphosphate reductase, adenosylcobalamin-dependent [Candidatus Peregrinibacteria bacterium CG10_big_fil_rev_8_21_14_0_10_49_16]
MVREKSGQVREREERTGGGLSISRRFTTPGSDPLEEVRYEKRTSRITNPDGSTVFEMEGAEIPAHWTQVATDIMVSKYFRKAGVPQYDEEGNLRRSELGEVERGPERSAKQVIKRLAGCWRHWGQQFDYFATAQDAQAFEDEISYMLVHQMAAPNSPQWFNTGLHYAYGISGPAQGHYYCDPETGTVKQSEDAYTHPQPHACFIQSVDDDLVNDGGIMDLWVREARLFKYGSGTGTNFSNLRGAGEPLSGGGKSSGLMSWLRIGDRAAGAIKSGGTTRRAAKMVCLDLDHPDIGEFIDWKMKEEKKVAALVKEGYDSDFNGEAYQTVSGQNSNNSVRAPHDFFEAIEKDGTWNLYWRTEKKTAEKEGREPQPCKTVDARELWEKIGFAAWECADPGVQYDTTINDWHTCPADGSIRASNPCSEYMFLDNTACNLASLNLLKFYDEEHGVFDLEHYKHAVRLWTIVLEISVLMAQFPSKEIANLSYKFRTLGLGYANMGALLMRMGIPYDSEKGRAICGALTAILTGESYAASGEMAGFLGAFSSYEKNREHMLRVIRNHRRAAYNVPVKDYEELHVTPVAIDQGVCPDDMLEAAKECWDRALMLGERHGYRNAQTTVIAPTGTIGLLMDCDTTGIEPDFALVKFKKLAGGGYMKIANNSVLPALKKLGYSEEQIADMKQYVMGSLSLESAPHINRRSLRERGFTDEDIAKVEEQLPRIFELSFAMNRWTLGEETMKRLHVSEEQMNDFNFHLLFFLGFTKEQIAEANEHICGRMTIEGAPHIKPEHLSVFDCANRCGKTGKRFIAPEGHIRMMASAQPFISGAISKTINLPKEATVEDIKNAYFLSWKLGLKANALYRDGCKMSQALNTTSDEKDSKDAKDTKDSKGVMEKEVIEKVIYKEKPRRRKLPNERMTIAHKFVVSGMKGYIHVGMYEDGSPGEIFITMSKDGSTLSGVMDTLALSLSLNLQYGVPIEVICEKLIHKRFEPMGMTGNPEIPMVRSIMDYLARWLALKFLPKETAKKFHNPQLVDRAYSEGSKSQDAFAMRLPVVDEGASITELRSMPRMMMGVTNSITLDASSDIEVQQAKLKGFTGSACTACGSMHMKRNGSCEVCIDCGATSGCS